MARLPVTLISGFLGAGKTSLLSALLNQCSDMRTAVIVNDMSQVNIDGQLIARSTSLECRPDRLVELTNGCICCSLREDFLIEVGRLAAAGQFDYLLIESTGISEPLPVADIFTWEGPDGRVLLQRSSLDTLTTVVDARNFLDSYQSADSLSARGIKAGSDGDAMLVELLVEQVEFANVLVLNKTDLVSASELDLLQEILRQLNPEAAMVRATYGQVASSQVLNTQRYDAREAARLPGWMRAMTGAAPPHPSQHGIGSFVYTARRPFHPERLSELLQRKPWRNILRSKGFVWLANRPEVAGLWSQAGQIFDLTSAGTWWAAVLPEERPPLLQAALPDGWHPQFGDRRQEIVFIGQNLDRAGLTAALHACLLTDAEMAAGEDQWRNLPDPLPAWDVAEELAGQRQPSRP